MFFFSISFSLSNREEEEEEMLVMIIIRFLISPKASSFSEAGGNSESVS